MPRSDSPPATVLICARNEATNLRQHLPAILQQHYPPGFEVLVVDDNSTDDTAAVLANCQRQFPQLRVEQARPKQRPGKKDALAQGIAAAQNDWLVLTDADCAPASPHWLAEMLAATVEEAPPDRAAARATDHVEIPPDGAAARAAPTQQRPPSLEKAEEHSTPLTSHFSPLTSLVLGYAPLLPDPGWLNAWARFETAYTAMQYAAMAARGWPYMGVGRNLAWHRSVFERAGGFTPHLHLASGDDDLLVNAVAGRDNTALCLEPEAFVWSAAETTLGAWLRQKRRHLSAGLVYRRWHQLAVGAVAFTQALHYGLGAILLLAGWPWAAVLGLWALRQVVVWPVYAAAFRRLGERGLVWWAPVLDGLLAVWLGGVAPVLLLLGNAASTSSAEVERGFRA